MQKTLQEVALFNYKQRGTLPRHDAKAQLMPWPGQHISIAGTSSIHLFSNNTLIPCMTVPSESTTSLHQLSYTWQPIWSYSMFCKQFFKKEITFKFIWNNSHKNGNRLQFYKRNPFKMNRIKKKRFTKKLKTPLILKDKSL